jgi:hypothetical protein
MEVRPDGWLGVPADAPFRRLFLVFFFLFFFVLVDQIAVFALFFFVLIFVVIIVIVLILFGNDVQMHGMCLGNFHFGFALWAAQDFAFLHFVFIDVDFRGTFGAANHGNILRKIGGPTRTGGVRIHVERIIYRVCEVNSHAWRYLRPVKL